MPPEQNVWVGIPDRKASWHGAVEGVHASGCIAQGPVFVFHHNKRDDQVLRNKKLRSRSRSWKHTKQPLFERFNRSQGNGAWPLVQARLGPDRLEELVKGGPKPAAE